MDSIQLLPVPRPLEQEHEAEGPDEVSTEEHSGPRHSRRSHSC